MATLGCWEISLEEAIGVRMLLRWEEWTGGIAGSQGEAVGGVSGSLDSFLGGTVGGSVGDCLLGVGGGG